MQLDLNHPYQNQNSEIFSASLLIKKNIYINIYTHCELPGKNEKWRIISKNNNCFQIDITDMWSRHVCIFFLALEFRDSIQYQEVTQMNKKTVWQTFYALQVHHW